MLQLLSILAVIAKGGEVRRDPWAAEDTVVARRAPEMFLSLLFVDQLFVDHEPLLLLTNVSHERTGELAATGSCPSIRTK
jgi:hypothetical protein